MSALKGPMDNFFKPKKSSTNSSNSNHPPISSNHLEVSHFVYQISNNLDILSRIKANKKKIPYKYEANYDLVSKGYPKGKAQAVALAKRVHGKHAVTVGDLRSTPNARGYWRCEICLEYPSAMLKSTKYPIAKGCFAAEGTRWDWKRFTDHLMDAPHKEAVTDSRNADREKWLLQNPQENVNDFTANPLLRRCIEERKILYEMRLTQLSQVYTDMKCLTVSAYSFPSRALSTAHSQHLIDLGSKPYEEFKPTEDQCRYNSPTAHGRYRENISDDIFTNYLKPLFGPDLLSASVAYDGWRAFAELYIHGSRLVFRDGTIRHAVVGLIDPPCGGADGCVESFKMAYYRLFDSETELKAFMNKISGQTTDAAALNKGVHEGANVKIRRDVIKNEKCPEIICQGHCGHNAWKDWLNTMGLVGVCINDHQNFVSYTHRGEIQKDFKEYCDKTLFKDAPKESVYTPTRVTDGGTTRMAGHAFKSMMSLHNGLDCWMLFLDDRMSNGRDSTQRFGALAQFQKFTNYKKMRVRYLVQDLMRLYTIFDKSAQIIGIGILELHDIKDSVTGSMSEI